MARALLIFRDKAIFRDGSILELKLWRLPDLSEERPHGLKYSLFYGTATERIIGYDNESGKGDHRHYRGREEHYRFESPEKLIADFLADVALERGDKL